MAMLIPFPLLVLEVLAFLFFSSRFGFLSVLGAYLLPTLLGLLLLAFHSRTAMLGLVKRVQQGHRPEAQMLGMAASFLGSLLFLPPLLAPRILGVLLLLPGTRHLLVLWAQGWLAKQAARGSARMWSSGIRFESVRPDFRDVREEREATVIDVQALPPAESKETSDR